MRKSAKKVNSIRSLKLIDDSFQKYVITEDPISMYQDNNGVVFMNIYEFLLGNHILAD